MNTKQQGFTLVELIIVGVVTVILFAGAPLVIKNAFLYFIEAVVIAGGIAWYVVFRAGEEKTDDS